MIVFWTLIMLSVLAARNTFIICLVPPSPVQPTPLANRSGRFFIGHTDHGFNAVPDIIIALWNSPFDISDSMWKCTEQPPALSPNSVTLSGSPPKLRILSRIHFSAKTWSFSPALPGTSADSSSTERKPTKKIFLWKSSSRYVVRDELEGGVKMTILFSYVFRSVCLQSF